MKKIQVFDILRILIALLIAFFIGFIIILLVSEEPLYAFKLFLVGPFSSLRRIGNLVEMTIPLIFTGLAVAVAFEAGQFNIGAEGQFFFGAALATIMGIIFKIPAILHVPLALLGGIVGGGLVGGIPGLLKAKWQVNELVSSLMLNFIFLHFSLYLVNNHFRDVHTGIMASWKIEETAWLKQFIPGTRIHVGVFISIIMVIFTYYFLYRTKWGYALRMTGINKDFAIYSGINVASVIIYSQVISGALAGLGGAIEILGIHHRFQWQALPGYGFDGMIIAIMAKNNPAFYSYSVIIFSLH